jgi:hypothetical protein
MNKTMKNLVSYILGISSFVVLTLSMVYNSHKTANEFSITIDTKANNRVILECNLGCAWKKLRYNCESNTCESTIDQFGIHSESNKIKDPNLSDFNIDISRYEKTYSFKCSKGCVWTELSTNVIENEQTDFLLTQFGLEYIVVE